MTEYSKETAINEFAASADLDPKLIAQAYKGREGLLKERFSDAHAASVGAGFCLLGTFGSAICIVGDVAQAAEAKPMNANDLPTESLGVFAVCAFLAVAGYKNLAQITKKVQEDVKKFTASPELTNRPKL